MPKIQLKRVDHKLSRWTIDAHVVPGGLQRQWEKFGSARLSRNKKAIFLDIAEASFIKRLWKMKPNTTDLARDLERPRLGKCDRSIDGGGRERTPLVNRLFFFLVINVRVTTLDLRFLPSSKVAGQAFICKISICLAKRRPEKKTGFNPLFLAIKLKKWITSSLLATRRARCGKTLACSTADRGCCIAAADENGCQNHDYRDTADSNNLHLLPYKSPDV